MDVLNIIPHLHETGFCYPQHHYHKQPESFSQTVAPYHSNTEASQQQYNCLSYTGNDVHNAHREQKAKFL